MKNIIAFGGSNSKASINKQLAIYTASLVDGANASILDLNDFELPVYGIDLEEKDGIPENAHKFLNLIKETDGVVVSLAENNGSYAVAFKNLLDWMSRIEANNFYDKPMLLMATSPGGRGGQSVLAAAADRFPRHAANVVAQYSFPAFQDNFKDGKVTNKELNDKLLEAVKTFTESL